MFCPKCGSSNDAAAKFCIGCGNALALTDKSPSNSPTQTEEPASDESYYIAVLGDKNQVYYLDHFARFDDEKKIRPTWNWSAFLVTFFWLLYRKMWRAAAIYLSLPLGLLILFWLVGLVAGGLIGIVVTLGSFAFLVAVFVALPAYANGFYYVHCKRLIESECSSTQGTQVQLEALSAKGGISQKLLVTGVGLFVAAILGMLAAVAIPEYQDHAARTRLAQALTVGKAATQYVDGYYTQYRSLPRSLDAANFMMSLPPFVKAVNIDNQANTITITMKGGVAIDGKSFKFVTSQGGDRLSWYCKSDEIQDRYLPQECRRVK